MEPFEGCDDGGGEFLLPLSGERLSGAVAEEEGGRVVIRFEATVWQADVIGDDEVASFGREFVVCVGEDVVGFRGESGEDAMPVPRMADRAEDVFGGHEGEREGFVRFLDFPGGWVCGSVIGHRGAEDRGLGGWQSRAHGLEHFCGCGDIDALDAIGCGEADGPGDENDRVSGGGGGGGDGESHFSGRAVTEEADRVDGFAGGSGGDEDDHRLGWLVWAWPSERASS